MVGFKVRRKFSSYKDGARLRARYSVVVLPERVQVNYLFPFKLNCYAFVSLIVFLST